MEDRLGITRSGAYQGVRNVNFSENLAYIQNGLTFTDNISSNIAVLTEKPCLLQQSGRQKGQKQKRITDSYLGHSQFLQWSFFVKIFNDF